MRLSLRELDVMKCARESRGKNVRLAVYVFRRGDDRFAVAGSRFGEDAFAEGDDAVVIFERCLESVDGGKVLLDAAMELVSECFFLGVDDPLLKLCNLRVRATRRPMSTGPTGTELRQASSCRTCRSGI